MKLRSGKIVKQPLLLVLEEKLPEALHDKLSDNLNNLLVILENNKSFYNVLINNITKMNDIDDFDPIKSMIEEEYDNPRLDIRDLLKTTGNIALLYIGDHHFYEKYNIENNYKELIKVELLGSEYEE